MTAEQLMALLLFLVGVSLMSWWWLDRDGDLRCSPDGESRAVGRTVVMATPDPRRGDGPGDPNVTPGQPRKEDTETDGQQEDDDNRGS